MMPPPPSQEPLSPSERLGYGLFLLVVIALFAGEIATNFHPVKLAALFIVLFWVPLLAVHEGGHAVIAALLGWRVRRVVLGMGRTVLRFRVGATPVDIRLMPVEGFVEPTPTSLNWPRLKNGLIYFAGPGAELLLVVVVALLVGFDTLTTSTDHIGLIAVQSLCLAALVGVVINLIPHGVMTRNGFVANDGLGILLSFSLPDEHFLARMRPSPDVEEE
jgi:membrane-associated protease RseP (regulator of RpoE activity)